MKQELLQTISQVLIFIGAVIAALGGFGAHHFGKKVAKIERDDLLKRLQPFEKLAAEIHPALKPDAALMQLEKDFIKLKETVAKHEFTPLAQEIRNSLVSRLKPIVEMFVKKDLLIEITHETWTNSITQNYAGQLADILRESGFKVEGPKQITYYLVQKSSPVEWGISPGIENEAGALFEVLNSIFIPNDKWTKRTFDKTKNRLRIHFGGAAIFQKNGIVTVE